jgi:hypothetical protein
MADCTYELDTCHKLLHGDLIFSRKVVEMLNQAGHDLAHPRCGLWTSGVDDKLRKVRIESMCLGNSSWATRNAIRLATSLVASCSVHIRFRTAFIGYEVRGS